MSRQFVKCLYICTVLIIASFATTAVGLSMEMQQIAQMNEEQIQRHKRADEVTDVRLQELELKVQRLETKLMELQNLHQTSHKPDHFDLKESAVNLDDKLAIRGKTFFRTCREIHRSDPSLSSSMYWIDPDGYGFEDPIRVYCDMETGKTSVPHDSEDPTDVGHCAKPGCYSKLIKYSAPIRQMEALAELSGECHQSIRYNCNLAPLEINRVAYSWWNDRNGVAQYFWSGSNNSIHTCQCGIDKNCTELHNFCNCDSSAPVPLSDIGVITDKKYLPVTRLNFGRTQFKVSSGVYTLGKFECTGQSSATGMPKSCSDLWKIGHSLSGIYSVMGSSQVETVYCNFEKLPHELGFETWIGYSDVKSSPVYFYAQRNNSRNEVGKVPFELMRLNVGGAMNANSGIFTAPRNGIYSFHFSGVLHHPPASFMNNNDIVVSLVLNGNEIGCSKTENSSPSTDVYYTHSLDSTLELKANDQVWISTSEFVASLPDSNNNHFTHFTGNLLRENVASSLKRLT